VKIKVVWIGKTKEPAIQSLTDEYLKRISRYADVEGTAVSDEDAFLKFRERSGTRPSYTLVLLDSRGKQFTSEGFAAFVQDHFAGKSQPLLFAIGGADGFSDTARQSATHVISLGAMTMAHEIARVVFLEQLYRAFAILNRHPYHSEH
jgi:23S rRNA (pseudouridine1915-N3)-methyltransferase